MSVLVLAGTSEAAALVDALVARGVDVVASLAGRTAAPRPLPCPTRVGGFGGADAFSAELRTLGVHATVDATHPFADQMPAQALHGAASIGVPYLRLLRPPWERADDWIEVDDLVGAARALRDHSSRRVMLTVGRQELDAFRSLDGIALVVRSVDAPPAGPWEVVLGRGPFSFDEELSLLRAHHIDTVVTRNSGGPTTKLAAARSVGARLVVVRRPPPLDAPTVHDVEAAVKWVLKTSS